MDKKASCAARSGALVLFGATGDLAYKKIFPVLYAMAKRNALKLPIIGVATKDGAYISEASPRQRAETHRDGIRQVNL